MTLSNLPKTWLIDVDGTIVRHNGHKFGGDILLDGVREFFAKIPQNDKIILLTARLSSEIPALESFLKSQNIRFDSIISDLPFGERILINDNKPSGLICGYAINKKRDAPLQIDFKIDNDL